MGITLSITQNDIIFYNSFCSVLPEKNNRISFLFNLTDFPLKTPSPDWHYYLVTIRFHYQDFQSRRVIYCILLNIS